jgi:hypothetical protein
MTDTSWIFRGVSAPEHYPIPSIGREKQYGPYKRAQEERLFQEFKHRAVTLIHGPEFDNWHWLAYAQHLGVPTRLLDWTTSPLIAAFFALLGDANTDRAIYCVKYSKFIHEVDQKADSPFECVTEGRFTPPLLFDRIPLGSAGARRWARLPWVCGRNGWPDRCTRRRTRPVSRSPRARPP